MLVRALMTGAPITLPPDISIFEARRLMDNARIRHVLVTLGGDLLGIVTDRDIRLNMPSQATSLSVWELNYLLAKVTVGEVMTRSVITIVPISMPATRPRSCSITRSVPSPSSTTGG